MRQKSGTAVENAVAEGRVEPARFGISPVDLSLHLDPARPSGLEGLRSRRGFAAAANPIGLEAIVRRVGRPPMLIRSDRVAFEAVPLLPQLTEAHVRRIEKFIPSVGRMEFVNHAMRWGGTGFVVDEAPKGRRRVVTNRHVAKLVARRGEWGPAFFCVRR